MTKAILDLPIVLCREHRQWRGRQLSSIYNIAILNVISKLKKLMWLPAEGHRLIHQGKLKAPLKWQFKKWSRQNWSLMFHFTQNIQVRQQWRWACNLWFCATHNMDGLATPYTNHQQHTNTMSTADHSVSKYRNQAQKTWRKTILWSTSNW